MICILAIVEVTKASMDQSLTFHSPATKRSKILSFIHKDITKQGKAQKSLRGEKAYTKY